MIRRLLCPPMPGRPAREPRIYARRRASGAREQVQRGARTVIAEAARGGLQGVRRRRRRARPAARHRAQGLRHRHRRDARAGEAAVPPRLHHRPALPPRARACRRGVIEVSTFRAAQTRERRRPTSTAACCPTTSSARRPRTRRGATSRSTRCTSIRRPRRCGTTSAASTDIRARRLKLIGAPVTRYREDPVRMLRAVRLAAKLGLDDRPEDRASRSRSSRRSIRTCRRRACSTRC